MRKGLSSEEWDKEFYSGNEQCQTKTWIEECYENLYWLMHSEAFSEDDPEDDHHYDDDVSLQIKSPKDTLFGITVAFDAFGMFSDDAGEDEEIEGNKHQHCSDDAP